MKAKLVFSSAILAVTAAACSQANASGLDPANPIHCAAIFQSYSLIANAQGGEGAGRGWAARSQFYMERARTLPPENLTDAALLDVGNRVAALTDGGLALATECTKRLEADPEFKALMHKLGAEEGRLTRN